MGPPTCEYGTRSLWRELIRALQISHGVPEAEIAIITPYQAQVAHLSSLLRDDFPGLVCGSVDGMQGQEREVSGSLV